MYCSNKKKKKPNFWTCVEGREVRWAKSLFTPHFLPSLGGHDFGGLKKKTLGLHCKVVIYNYVFYWL